jgi:hypothetical protein
MEITYSQVILPCTAPRVVRFPVSIHAHDHFVRTVADPPEQAIVHTQGQVSAEHGEQRFYLLAQVLKRVHPGVPLGVNQGFATGNDGMPEAQLRRLADHANQILHREFTLTPRAGLCVAVRAMQVAGESDM